MNTFREPNDYQKRWEFIDIEKTILPLLKDNEKLSQFIRENVEKIGLEELHGRIDLRGISFFQKMNGQDLSGIKFSQLNFWYADFSGCNLKNSIFEDCNLAHATFRNAYLRNAIFRNCELTGSNFLESNLNQATMDNCTLQYIKISECIANPQDLLVTYPREVSERKFDLAARIYRSFKANALMIGDYRGASWTAYKQLQMEQKDLWRNHNISKWVLSVFSWFLWGYGERPARLALWVILFSFICAILYSYTGIKVDGVIYNLSNTGTKSSLEVFLHGLYLSFITITTVGYGDVVPQGWSMFIAPIEALGGVAALSLFVSSLVSRLMAR